MYSYTAEFYNKELNGYNKEHGVVGANSYGEAVNKVVEFYGEEHILSVCIYELQNPATYDELREMIGEED